MGLELGIRRACLQETHGSDFERAKPYTNYAWKALCSHHSSQISTDASKRTLPEVCICHAGRAEKDWSCRDCQELTDRLLEDHYIANIDAKLHQVHPRRANREGFVDIEKVEQTAPWREWSDWDKMFEDWNSVEPSPLEMRRMCPFDSCEEEGFRGEFDGKFRVMYCITCRGIIHLTSFAVSNGY